MSEPFVMEPQYYDNNKIQQAMNYQRFVQQNKLNEAVKETRRYGIKYKG